MANRVHYAVSTMLVGGMRGRCAATCARARSLQKPCSRGVTPRAVIYALAEDSNIYE